jgi:hypothetical protein
MVAIAEFIIRIKYFGLLDNKSESTDPTPFLAPFKAHVDGILKHLTSEEIPAIFKIPGVTINLEHAEIRALSKEEEKEIKNEHASIKN